jgi:hypothetical protein
MKIELLTYYTELAQQHRTKVCFLLGVYLVLGQVLLFTPLSVIAAMRDGLLTQQLVSDILAFGGGVACLISLLTIGMLHHLSNLIFYATKRLEYERKCLVESHQEDFASWEEDFTIQLSTTFSVSIVSALLAGVFGAGLWSLMLFRVTYLIRYLFEENPVATQFAGAFILLQLLMVTFYGVVIISRCRAFYKARALWKLVERYASERELKKKLECYGIRDDVLARTMKESTNETSALGVWGAKE